MIRKKGDDVGNPDARTVELFPAVECELVAYRYAEGSGDRGLVVGREGKPWNDYAYRNWQAHKFRPAAAGTTATRPSSSPGGGARKPRSTADSRSTLRVCRST